MTDNQDKDYEIQKLNLLAFPRDFCPKCELTGAPSRVQLVTQHCTLVSIVYHWL